MCGLLFRPRVPIFFEGFADSERSCRPRTTMPTQSALFDLAGPAPFDGIVHLGAPGVMNRSSVRRGSARALPWDERWTEVSLGAEAGSQPRWTMTGSRRRLAATSMISDGITPMPTLN